jgi:hypothetical protein
VVVGSEALVEDQAPEQRAARRPVALPHAVCLGSFDVGREGPPEAGVVDEGSEEVLDLGGEIEPAGDVSLGGTHHAHLATNLPEARCPGPADRLRR